MRTILPAMALLLLLSVLAGCPQPVVIHVLVEPHCEGTNPRHCMLPWPSGQWLAEDSSTTTGYHLAYDPEGVPRNDEWEPFDAEPYTLRDGFSPASVLLTTFAADVDTEAIDGLALEGMDELSLLPDSPTVLLDLSTGERIAHWVEVDARAHEGSSSGMDGEPELFYLHASARLEGNRSYGVAIRGIKLVDGTDAMAYPVFEALRDGVITDAEVIEAQRDGYEEMFTVLETAGVDRDSLVQAWRFHTASDDNITRDLLAMRDDAMERMPVGSGECVADEIQEDFDGNTFRRIDGTFKVPLYVDSDEAGARLVRGPDGLPEFQGWADAPFTMLIPQSLAGPDDEPGRLLHFGHGLMGTAEGEGGGGYLRGLGNQYGLVTVATDWWGMSLPDVVTVTLALANVSEFPKVGERLMQGVVNHLVMTRSFKGACRTADFALVDGEPVIDEGEPYYLGISQGGIMGGTVMALSEDISKGALLVGAANYPLMLSRSVNFAGDDGYEAILVPWYRRRIDREILMAMVISFWDYAEPNPFLPHIFDDPFPNTPPKQILYQVGRHDAQVPNVASDFAVRTMGIPQLDPPLLDLHAVDVVSGPVPSAYVYYDFGAPDPGPGNGLRDDNSVHGSQRQLEATKAQLNAFWQPEGMVMSFCEGVCDPE